jgi:phosphatidylinositol 4-kinase
MHFPDDQVASTINTVMPVLIDILRDIPYIDFDQNLFWDGMVLENL